MKEERCQSSMKQNAPLNPLNIQTKEIKYLDIKIVNTYDNLDTRGWAGCGRVMCGVL